MFIPSTYSEHLSLREKILYALSLFKKATADEIATEIIELQGVSTEEGVADITIEISGQQTNYMTMEKL